MARKGKLSAASYPTAFHKRWCWDALTLLAFVTIGAIVVGIIWLAASILGFLQPLLVPIAAAGIIAYLLDPLVKKLEARGVPARRAVYVVYISFLALMLALVLSVSPAFLHMIEDNTSIIDKAQTGVSNFVSNLQKEGGLLSNPKIQPIFQSLQNAAKNPENWNWLKEQAPEIAGYAWGFIGKSFGLLGYLIGFFLIPLYLFFFLREAQPIKKNWSNYVPLKASKLKDEVVGVLQEINGYLIAFFRGQLLVSMIDGVLVAMGLLIIGLPYAIPIGVFVALLGLIPYIGNLICLIPAVIISMSHFSNRENQIFGIEQIWMYPLIVIGIFFCTQQLNSLVTAPKIVGDSVGLHPVTVIFSVLFWTTLIGGFLGSLLAVPLTASVKVLFRRYIWEMKFQHEMVPEDLDALPPVET